MSIKGQMTFIGGILIVWVLITCACQAPPDPSLSLEVVAQNVAQYKGKRVRWYGTAASFKLKDKGQDTGKGTLLILSFGDPTKDFRVTTAVFDVETESPKDNIFSFFDDLNRKPCWVTGTIVGSYKETISGSGGTREVEVPLLRNAKFEQE